MKSNILFFLFLAHSVQAMDSHLLSLPIELQKYLCLFFIVKNTDSRYKNCLRSIKNFRNFVSTCKKFYNDEQLAIFFIDHLDYNSEDKLLNATRLNTPILENYKQKILNNYPDTKKQVACALVKACLNDSSIKQYVELLLKTGISPNIDNSDFTPLTAAAYCGNIPVMNILLHYDARIDQRNSRGNTALHEAAHYGHIKAINLLIANKADLNIQSNTGNTALMNACNSSRLPIVALLLKTGVNWSIKNNVGQTAEDIITLNLQHWTQMSERNPVFRPQWDDDYSVDLDIWHLLKTYQNKQ